MNVIKRGPYSEPFKVKVPEQPKRTCDVLLVGYDDDSGDIPVLTVGRKKGNEVEIVNLLQGPTATDVYKQLLHRLSVPVVKEDSQK